MHNHSAPKVLDEFIKFAGNVRGLSDSFLEKEIQKNGDEIIKSITSLEDLYKIDKANWLAAWRLIKKYPAHISALVKTSKDCLLLFRITEPKSGSGNPNWKDWGIQPKLILSLLSLEDFKESHIKRRLIYLIENADAKFIEYFFKTARDVIDCAAIDNECRKFVNKCIEKNSLHIAKLFKTANDFIHLAQSDVSFYKSGYRKLLFLHHPTLVFTSTFGNKNSIEMLEAKISKYVKETSLNIATTLCKKQPEIIGLLFNKADDFVKLAACKPVAKQLLNHCGDQFTANVLESFNTDIAANQKLRSVDHDTFVILKALQDTRYDEQQKAEVTKERKSKPTFGNTKESSWSTRESDSVSESEDRSWDDFLSSSEDESYFSSSEDEPYKATYPRR